MASQLEYQPQSKSTVAVQAEVAAFIAQSGNMVSPQALSELFVGHMGCFEVLKVAYVQLGSAGQAIRPVLVFGDDAQPLLESADLCAIVETVFALGRPFIWAPPWPDRVVRIEAAVRLSSMVAPVVGGQGGLGLVWAATLRHLPLNLGEQSMFAAAAASYAAVGLALMSDAREGPPRLTRRERECLAWASEGKSDWMIGEILKLAEPTVHMHVENAKRKLGSTSRYQAILRAWRLGLLVAC